MSNIDNGLLLERAAEAIDFCTNSPDHIDDQIVEAIERNDLERVFELVAIVDGRRSQEEFADNDIY